MVNFYDIEGGCAVAMEMDTGDAVIIQSNCGWWFVGETISKEDINVPVLIEMDTTVKIKNKTTGFDSYTYQNKED